MFQRQIAETLQIRLTEAPRRIQILAGPRQVGKTTLVTRILEDRIPTSRTYITADEGAGPIEVAFGQIPPAVVSPPRSPKSSPAWLADVWEGAAAAASAWSASRDAERLPYVLAIDEIQKVPNWSESVKGLWDRNLRARAPMHVVLLGSSPLLVQEGLSESLAGRFELIRMPHWSFDEMNEAFSWTLDQYIYFGGYPGSASLVADEPRWRDFVRKGLIEPNIEKDVFETTRVDQRALLKQLFELGCVYSGQIMALNKIPGALTGKGHTLTLARYLELLDRAGLLRGIQKYSDHEVRRRRSPPKFQALNGAFVSALSTYTFEEAKADRSHWGRLVESAVGAHLCNSADADTRLHYWREGSLEVDFVASKGRKLLAIEVKSGKNTLPKPGLDEFRRRNRRADALVVGGEDCQIGEFLRQPASRWLG